MMIRAHSGVSGANLEHGYALNGIELQSNARAGSVLLPFLHKAGRGNAVPILAVRGSGVRIPLAPPISLVLWDRAGPEEFSPRRCGRPPRLVTRDGSRLCGYVVACRFRIRLA
jgi:hypothetical protein